MSRARAPHSGRLGGYLRLRFPAARDLITTSPTAKKGAQEGPNAATGSRAQLPVPAQERRLFSATSQRRSLAAGSAPRASWVPFGDAAGALTSRAEVEFCMGNGACSGKGLLIIPSAIAVRTLIFNNPCMYPARSTQASVLH